MKKNITIVVTLLIMVAAVGVYVFFGRPVFPRDLQLSNQILQQQNGVRSGCLNNDEESKYELTKKENNHDKATIWILDKNTLIKKSSLQIDILSAADYHSLEVHRCWIYAPKSFNYDYVTHKSLAGYSAEIWRYDYRGNGEKIVTLGIDTLGNLKGYEHFFSSDFRVDPSEQYLSLIKGYSGSPDYALIIKDLKTLKDVFVLSVSDMIKQDPGVVGDIGFENSGWSSDGRYFWFLMEQTADIVGFVRVDTKDWSYKIFPTPQRTMGGDAFNINTGMVTYGADVAPWSGVVEIDAQLQKEAMQDGQISSFYIYNLFTKQKYLVATTTDPTYYFRPRWISDSELQYELPTGEKKVYNIQER